MKKTALMILVAALWLAVFCGVEAEETKYVNNTNFNQIIADIATSSEKEFVFILEQDIKVNGISITRPGVTVTILGNNHELDIQGGWIQVEGDENQKAVLNLGKPGYKETLTIRGAKRNDNPGALYIQNNSVYNMYDGVTITGITNENYFGGGASVQGGTFNMYGGTISNCKVEDGSVCYGGGVAVYCNGTFNMYDGTISNCSVYTEYEDWLINSPSFTWLYPSGTGGGVYVGNRAAFNMYGGIITECHASMHGGGVMVQNSIKSLEENNNWNGYLDSRFEMTGGSIEKCTADLFGGGIAVLGTYDVSAPIEKIATDIYPERQPTMNAIAYPGVSISGAEICRNDASYGGGILVSLIRKEIPIEKTKFIENTAYNGAGIYVLSDMTKLNFSNCTITGNIANGKGGGLVVDDNKNGGKTTIRNTILCNNIAKIAASDVYVRNSNVVLSRADGMGTYNGEPDVLKGKLIDGWYTDEEKARYKDGTRTEFTGYATDITQNGAKHYLIAAVNSRPVTVTFDANGHGTAPSAQNLLSGEKATNPGELSATDCIFTGWYEDEACTTLYNFAKTLSDDLTLYAGWK